MVDSVQSLNTLDFIDEAEQQYFAEAQLGYQVEEFLRSPTGRLLHGRAKQQLEQAKEDVLGLDTEDPDCLRKLKQIRTQAEVARCFMRWCAEAIDNGNAAQVQLEEHRS